MTYRALELLNLPPDEPAFLLDIGCGSGLSGEILDEEGYIWTGVDIAPSMLGKNLAIFVRGIDVTLPSKKLRSNEKSKGTCSYKTSDRALDFAQVALTAPSGMQPSVLLV